MLLFLYQNQVGLILVQKTKRKNTKWKGNKVRYEMEEKQRKTIQNGGKYKGN
jgi:hypothetical protein